MPIIQTISTRDFRRKLKDGAGSDAVHTDPSYGYGVTLLETDNGLSGTGIAYTLGDGTNLVCEAIRILVEPLKGREIEELMAEFGAVQRSMAEHPGVRWLGPHKGVTHLALASITNACFDLWAKSRGEPVWKLLLDLSPGEITRLVDFSYLEEVLSEADAAELLQSHQPTRAEREGVLKSGYPGYDTSVGWFQYSDEKIRDNAKAAVDAGFTAMKLKVGARDHSHDVRRSFMVREAVGDDVRIMLDANQAWPLPQAIDACLALKGMNPFWMEEPTQPDDVSAHKTLADRIAPVPVAVGEAVSNRVLWKNFLQAGAVGIVQADCTRLAGISEWLAVVMLARKFPVRLVPHVGDMGQIHQHLVLFGHIALGHEKLFLEYIPHLRDDFVHPANVDGGHYMPPQEPGCSTDLHLS
ncbi:MAG: enolase C-terminal domain-like protein [Verrucomicrobiota bacterium]|jgi:L-fuconate dehydratase|nr:enolase C-terminal domain-like protein [Verrucomicrobiota bacterium]MDP7049350.1 enolase C-terminal domain-like protein [Verrucomicrobiota bacterium]